MLNPGSDAGGKDGVAGTPQSITDAPNTDRDLVLNFNFTGFLNASAQKDGETFFTQIKERPNRCQLLGTDTSESMSGEAPNHTRDFELPFNPYAMTVAGDHAFFSLSPGGIQVYRIPSTGDFTDNNNGLNPQFRAATHLMSNGSNKIWEFKQKDQI